MPYAFDFTQRAERDLRGLDRKMQRRVAQTLDALAEEPRPDGVTKLKDRDDVYRVRVGQFRILYSINDEALTVLVIGIPDREDAYR